MLYRYPFVVMGSGCELLLEADNERFVLGLVHTALRELHRLEQKYSRFREDSLLSAINREAHRRSVALDPETQRLLEFAGGLHAATGGRFDVTVGSLHACWNFRAMHLPEEQTLARARAGVGWSRHVELANDAVRLHHPATRLDLGGIVKEYALDTTAAVLQAMGVQRGLINLGGDLRTVRAVPLDRRPFRVGVAHPRRHHATVAALQLRDGAVVTSGDYQRYFLRDGVRHHHLLDPATGRPCELLHPAVTAHAATALEALHACKRLLLAPASQPVPDAERPAAYLLCGADGEPVAWQGSRSCAIAANALVPSALVG